MLLSLGMASPVARRLSRSSATLRLSLLVALWSSVQVGLSQTLPYVPTTILLPDTNNVPLQENVSSDVAYIFSPSGDSVSLLALNISTTIQSSDLSLDVLSSELPFLAGGNVSFTPSIANNGTIIVYAGNCSSSSGAGVWTMDPPQQGSEANWTQSSMGSSSSGPGYLGAALSFSTTLEPVMGPMDIYVYGGMCPSDVTDVTLSQSEATYSNQMLRLSPSDSSSTDYSVHSLTNKGAPIAEAGFTFTGLSPSISNKSGVVTQQANYVVLGGHTETAFINISTAAIWSLPEESWGFVSISTAGSSGSTELAVKSTPSTMDPRSGHTAVLNEDGSAIIVLGGWVGNTQTAASPQLAVLDLGLGYGGNGAWQWTIPDEQPSGSGIYGHGAALLPGNIMMVYGGHDISSGKSSKRQTTTKPSFLNLTSMSWSEDYTNPTYAASTGDDSSDDDEDASKQLGLGLGLGLGFGAIILAILAYFLFRWRNMRKYSSREDIIRNLAQDTNHYLQDEPMMERDDGQNADWYLGGHDPYMTGGRSLGYQSLQTGRGSIDAGAAGFSYTPAPMIRKPVAPRTSRGHYMPAPISGYESPMGHRTSRSGGIHPIYEADEETQTMEEPISPIRDTARDSVHSDPFLTPVTDRPLSFPQASHAAQSPGTDGRPQTDPDVQDWMSDVDAADALLTGRMATHSAGGAGRTSTSPVRRNTVKSIMSVRSGHNVDDDSRTNSNLSDSSRGVSRSGSQRSHLRLGFGVSPGTAAAEERSGTSSSDSSQPSYHTAKSIPTLQAEGPSLLIGRRRDRDEYDDTPGSPSKDKPRRSQGWLGSLRRVFSGSTPSSASPGSYLDAMRDSMAEASDYDPQSGGLGSIAAGGLFRRKGGRGAWEAGDAGFDEDLPLGRRRTGEDGDDEWDIEKAVERRLVQVMFTVPREPLRVVNGEPDIESGESVIVIDPETDERVEMDAKRRYELRDEPRTPTEMAEASYAMEKQALRGEEEEAMLDKGKQREAFDSTLGSEIGPPSYIPTHRDTVDSGLGSDLEELPHERSMTEELEGLHPSSAAEVLRHDSLSSLEDPFSSPSIRQRSRDSHHSDAPILSAQAVQLQRPERALTRVMAMVESIESRSRSASPDRP